jgi:hypothetical protein
VYRLVCEASGSRTKVRYILPVKACPVYLKTEAHIMNRKPNGVRLRVVAAVLVMGLALPMHRPAALAQEKPGKSPAQTGKDKDGWKSLFDGKTLDGWKTSDDPDDGKVSVKDSAIVLKQGHPMSSVAYRRGDFPKMDYEVQLEGKKLDGNDFFCTTTFPVGDSFCSLVVGGWGGTTVGLSSINSLDASMNETSTSKEFKRDQWYRVRIRVTRDRIQAWIDDEKLVDVEIADKKLSIRLECAQCKPFGIATWHTAGAVRNIRVRALTTAEKKAPAGSKSGDKE